MQSFKYLLKTWEVIHLLVTHTWHGLLVWPIPLTLSFSLPLHFMLAFHFWFFPVSSSYKPISYYSFLPFIQILVSPSQKSTEFLPPLPGHGPSSIYRHHISQHRLTSICSHRLTFNATLPLLPSSPTSSYYISPTLCLHSSYSLPSKTPQPSARRLHHQYAVTCQCYSL